MRLVQSKKRGHAQEALLNKLLYSPEEAALLLSMSRARVYRLLARRRISSIKEGRARLIPLSALESYIAQRMHEQAPVA